MKIAYISIENPYSVNNNGGIGTYSAMIAEAMAAKNNEVHLITFRMIRRLRGEKLTKQCILREGRGLLLEADGTVRPCGMDEELLLGHIQDDDYFWLDNIPDIIQKDICSKCDTDSYYNWTEEAQKTIVNEMLKSVKKKRYIYKNLR